MNPPNQAAVSEAARFGSGRDVRRVEDEKLVSGRGHYADDLVLEGQHHLCFQRSPYAHARIVSIDAEAARGMPGVAAVYTGADLVAAGVKPLPTSADFKRADGAVCASPLRQPLAHERVRFVGEAVVAVVADSPQHAKDAAEAVLIEYEELPFVVNLAQATAPSAPAVCDAAPDNIAAEMQHGDADAAAAAFAKAAHRISLDVVNQRVVALTMEPRTVIASIEPKSGNATEPVAAKRLAVRISSQMPTGVRTTLSAALGLQPEQIRVTVGDVGGGFGMKTGAYPEDVVVAYAAWNLERPVKWAAERSEDFTSATHGRDVESKLELALDAEGRIL
ncbi:MAG: molybdopterin cofactor-binding domain-containing protein, partial [Burkholderiales bacterium]